MMLDYKLNDFNIPVGMCEITYGDIILPSIGSEGVFQATPKYKKAFGGRLNSTQKYLLEDYDVSFEVSFEQESIEMLTFYMPTLQMHENGMYDNPQNVNMSGKQLIIHPYLANGSKQYDICIWNAYIDPETSFQRVFSKETNKYKVRFIGKIADYRGGIVNSYFYIGDWSKVGVSE